MYSVELIDALNFLQIKQVGREKFTNKSPYVYYDTALFLKT